MTRWISVSTSAPAWVRSICISAFAAATWASSTFAATVNVGTISLTDYRLVGPANGAAGVSAIATQNVNLANTCLAGATVHWIQLVTVSTPMGPVLPPGIVGPPQPNLGFATFANYSNFIDPIPGQNIGGGQTGNATPFYDITVNNVADFADNTKWLRDGTGTVWGDAPNIPFNALNAGNTPWTMTFQTLLVATTAAKPNTLLDLGGFQWGFSMGIKPQSATLNQATALTFANLNVPTWQSALDAFFGPAGTYTLAEATCPKGDPVVGFKIVPEPSSVVMAALAFPGIIVLSIRHRRRVAA